MFTVNQFICRKEEEILKKIEGKKVICYGASTQYPEFYKIVDVEPWVSYIVDNNRNRWGELYHGKEIRDPKVLKNEKLGTYIVLITSKYFMEIGRELEGLGLKKDVDYINLFELRHIYDIRQYVNAANHFIKYIDTLPDMKNTALNNKEQKLGVVVNAESLNYDVLFPYSIGLFLILKYKGYDVKLIVDELCGFGDTFIFQGFSSYCNELLEGVLEKLKEKVPESDIIYIDSEGKTSLDSNDEERCKKLADENAMWQRGRQLHNGGLMTEEEMSGAIIDSIKEQMSVVKKFFEVNKFDTINMDTGFHKKGGIYYHICQKSNIRHSTQDGNQFSLTIGSNSPCSHGRDITRVIKENWFTKQELERLLQDGKETYAKRIENKNSIRMKNSGEVIATLKYEDVIMQSPRSDVKEYYDVIIPMNVMWDAAAIGLNSIFNNYLEWLVETLEYVVNKLGKKVLVREHPAGEIWKMTAPAYAIPDYIIEPYKGNNLFRYVPAEEDLNLYQYIEHAKLVIPWSSTTGIEAATMGRNVLMHTDAYYADCDFVAIAHSKQQYFEYISSALEENNSIVNKSEKTKEEALIMLQLAMRRAVFSPMAMYNPSYRWIDTTWQKIPFKKLVDLEGVNDTIQVVVENVPSSYIAVKRQWERDDRGE